MEIDFGPHRMTLHRDKRRLQEEGEGDGGDEGRGREGAPCDAREPEEETPPRRAQRRKLGPGGETKVAEYSRSQ